VVLVVKFDSRDNLCVELQPSRAEKDGATIELKSPAETERISTYSEIDRAQDFLLNNSLAQIHPAP